jgi:hypothetical protein
MKAKKLLEFAVKIAACTCGRCDTENKNIPDAQFDCIFCGLPCIVAPGHGVMIHLIPACKEFIRLEANEFSNAITQSLMHDLLDDITAVGNA